MSKMENNDAHLEVSRPLIKKKRDNITITNNMAKITKDIASTLAEEVERQPHHSHTNYGFWSQSSLDPGAKMVSQKEAKNQQIPNGKRKDPQLWRDLVAYWILGLCNNYGYVVMLSAAHDIIDKFNHKEDASNDPVVPDSGRLCHVVSTGTILLADIVPSMLAKTSAPFLPFWVNTRVFISVVLAAAGFLLVAFATSEWMAILGVISTSFSCGLGETTFLAYSTHFNKNVVSTWSSGTGGAGVIGSLSYAALTSLNIGPANTMLIMLLFPAIEAVSFWVLLRSPSGNVDDVSESSSSEEVVDDEKPLVSIKEKIRYTFGLMKYMMPLTLVYFFEYFINQGLVPFGMAESLKTDEQQRSLRNIIGFLFLGFCTYFGYIVMLSAAHDIITKFYAGQETNDTGSNTIDDRHCNVQSTGLILLFDILPSMTAKLISPFVPLWINVRVGFVIILQICGLLLVALATASWHAYFGVILVSFSSGLSEASFLSYTSYFLDDVLSTWSSGTGAACLFAAAYYALLTVVLEPWVTILTCLWVPILQGVSFWIIVRKPTLTLEELSTIQLKNNPSMMSSANQELTTWREKLKFSVQVLLPKYMLPLTIVYFFEYFINQGLFELINFDNTFIGRDAQYRWFNFCYQFGVFISRSSIKCFHLDFLYLMAILQAINTVYFLLEAILYITPFIYITFIFIVWEGLLGGVAYVNTYNKMSREISPLLRVFSLGIVNQADSYGISLAGFISLPVHDAICKTEKPIRFQL